MKKTKKKVETRWVVENHDEGWTMVPSQVFLDIDDAMDHIDTLRYNAIPDSKIALYQAVRVPLPK
jgi:hypothetical protein